MDRAVAVTARGGASVWSPLWCQRRGPPWARPARERTPSRVIILHSNDIHGRIEGLARIATLVDQIRAEHAGEPILYVDLGDIEEPTQRLSSLTKGVAMHRLLSVAGCEVAAVGNGGPMRYGPQVLPEYAAAARYPLLLANLRQPDGAVVPGVRPSMLLEIGGVRLGLIGVTADMGGIYDGFGVRTPPVAPLVRELAAGLRREGADAVILLSHLGLPEDRALAGELQQEVRVILGGHTHDLLPEGERVGEVLIAQAGQYAEHLGRVDLDWGGARLVATRASVLSVTDAIPPATRVLDEARVIEGEVTQFLNAVVGELELPLDFATYRECGMGDLAADVLRERLDADLAVVAAAQAFTGPLPAGPLTRSRLWDVCSSTANPGVVEMTGAHLLAVLRRGLEPTFAAERPRALRGLERGLLHLAGASIHDGGLYIGERAVEPERTYRVAATDWELEPYGGYVEAEWALRPRYDMPTIMREAVEEYLALHRPARVALGRMAGRLAAGS